MSDAFDEAEAQDEFEKAEREAAAQPSMATDALPEAPPERMIGEPTPRERRWGQIVSFMSGSPLFGTVARASDALTGQRSVESARRATEQFSPKVAGVPVLPVLGGAVATSPAGAARVGGTLGGVALNTPRASAAARVGLQGLIGATQAADRNESVALGTGAGLVGGALGEGVGAAASSGMKALAQRMGLRAMGARAGITESLGRLGYETPEEGYALAEEALKSGVIRPGRTASDVANQAGEHQAYVSGPMIEDAIAQANASVAGGAKPFDFDEAAWKAAENLMSRGRAAPAPLNPQEQAAGRGAMSMVRRIAETATPDNLGSFSEANRLKQSLQNSINYGVNATKESQQMQRAAAAGMRQSIEEQVARAAGDDVAETLSSANSRWGAMNDVKQIALDEARRQAQRKFPLGTALMGAAAGGAGSQSVEGGLLGAGVTALGHYLSPRVPSTLAFAGHKAAPVARAVAPYLGSAPASVARESVADPLGPLRQYLGLSPEERRESDVAAFEASP